MHDATDGYRRTGEPLPPQSERGRGPRRATECDESLQEILDTLLTLERLSATLYYMGLMVPDLMLALRAGRNVATAHDAGSYLGAVRKALAQEHAHAHALIEHKARASQSAFFFPAATMTRLGVSTTEIGTFLWAMEYMEMVTVATYQAAILRLDAVGRHDLALLALEVVEAEEEQRMLARLIASETTGDAAPAPSVAVRCVRDATTALHPFLTRQGSTGELLSISVPTDDQIAAVLGHDAKGSVGFR